MKLSEFKGKKIIVMGLGLHGGGVGAAKFFSELGSRVIITDLKTKKVLALSLRALRGFRNISFVLGRHRALDLANADLIIKNPGVPDNSPWLKIARAHRIPIWSDIEAFFKFCPAPIIGITGTKGKSTAASVLFELLGTPIRRGSRAAPWVRQSRIRRGSRVWLGGNIRKSVLEVLPMIRKNDFVVLELSSFQLDSLAFSKRSPHIAVITNIFPDHLNRYRGFRNYALSKAGIFRFQGRRDYLFINKNDALLKKLSKLSHSRKILVDEKRYLLPFRAITERKFWPHQRASVALAVAVGRHLGATKGVIAKVLQRTRELSGRLETIRKVGGVTFVNDTTATNPGAAIAALKALSGKKRMGIVLIAGGSDKKLPSQEFARAIVKFAKAVVFLPGEATKKIKSKVKNQKSKIVVHEARTMQEAVRIAYALAEKGDTVLLSPGAASFGQFLHEFDRGEQFVKAVRAL